MLFFYFIKYVMLPDFSTFYYLILKLNINSILKSFYSEIENVCNLQQSLYCVRLRSSWEFLAPSADIKTNYNEAALMFLSRGL